MLAEYYKRFFPDRKKPISLIGRLESAKPAPRYANLTVNLRKKLHCQDTNHIV